MGGSDAVIDIAEYLAPLKRWWPIVVVATVLGGILGIFVLSLQSSEYEAEAQVEVRPLVIAGDDPNLDASRQVDLETERIIASSQRVIERALALLEVAEELSPGNPLAVDLDDPELELEAASRPADPDEARRIIEQIDVTSPNDSQILVITVSGAKAERAQQLAQATAHAYLDFRRDEGLSATNIAREQLNDREIELLEELDALASEFGAAGDNETRTRTLSYREISKREELAGIGAKLANIDSISIDPGEVLNDAGLPDSTTGIPGLAGPVLGGLLGLIAGLAGVFFLDRRDDRLRSPSVELTGMGLQVLGSVPVGSGRFKAGRGSAIAELNSPAGEAYRRVQGSLTFNLDQLDKSTVLVAGPNNPHSSSTVAANLAAAAARAGRRTLLVGADLRRPSLHERFGLDNSVGLSDVLSGQVPISQAIQTLPDLPKLQILPAGSPIDAPSRLLQGDGLGRMISAARAEFDLIVFEAPPVLQVADAVDLARLIEGAVLVVEPNRATRSGVADSVEQLRSVGADVIGTIVAASGSES